MRRETQWGGVILMLLTGAVVGMLNVVFSALVTNDLIGDVAQDEVAVSTYSINFFVGWVFFSAWFLAKADEEWKSTAEAVSRKNREEFMLAAPKRIALSIRVLYLLISLLVVLSFHLFHLENQLVLFEIQFGVGFLVAITIFVLFDLDDPTRGVIKVPNIPEEWLQALRKRPDLQTI
jgi:hypothetical protein